MNALVRACSTVNGEPKQVFGSKREGRAEISRRGWRAAKAYRCITCGSYHIGHPRHRTN